MDYYNDLADRALEGHALTQEQSLSVLSAPDDELLLVLHAAYRVRRRCFGDDVHMQILSNAKSGLCPEDCHYCSQSSASTAEIERYPLLAEDELLEQARYAARVGARRFCMALSGRTLTDAELADLCRIMRTLKEQTGLELCGSLGFLDEGQAEALRAAGLDRVNHNLNTSERFYSEICTTHTYADRVATIRRCRAAGLELCCGGIVGEGETHEDIVDLLMALREIRPESIPINFLVPVKGTPFEGRGGELTPRFCLKVLCLARFLNPDREIRAAGGREVNLRSLQPLALFAVNSLFVNGYLTTGGQPVEEARGMIADMGFDLLVEGDVPQRAGRGGHDA